MPVFPLPIELKKAVSAGNAHWLHIGDMHILISYETPVAFERGPAQFMTNRKFSRTTSRHLSTCCRGWKRIDHELMLTQISENLLVIIRQLKGGYDIVHESHKWNDVILDIIQLLAQINDQDWSDVEKLKAAVVDVQVAAVAAMLSLTGIREDAKILFPTTKRGTLVKAMFDMAARGELKGEPAPR